MRAEENKVVACIRTRDAALDWSMKGKTVLFTGASRGMGRFAAIELARLGAEILIVGHNRARGDAAAGAIRSTGDSAHFLRADMGDTAQVHALAEAVLARSPRIDGAISAWTCPRRSPGTGTPAPRTSPISPSSTGTNGSGPATMR